MVWRSRKRYYFKFGGVCGERMTWGCDGIEGDCLLVIYILIHHLGEGGEYDDDGEDYLLLQTIMLLSIFRLSFILHNHHLWRAHTNI